MRWLSLVALRATDEEYQPRKRLNTVCLSFAVAGYHTESRFRLSPKTIHDGDCAHTENSGSDC